MYCVSSFFFRTIRGRSSVSISTNGLARMRGGRSVTPPLEDRVASGGAPRTGTDARHTDSRCGMRTRLRQSARAPSCALLVDGRTQHAQAPATKQNRDTTATRNTHTRRCAQLALHPSVVTSRPVASSRAAPRTLRTTEHSSHSSPNKHAPPDIGEAVPYRYAHAKVNREGNARIRFLLTHQKMSS